MKKFKIDDMQKAEEEYEREQEQEKQRRSEMFKSFKKHGTCPDYGKHPEECRTKLGVYICWDTEEHRKYRCPIMNYSE